MPISLKAGQASRSFLRVFHAISSDHMHTMQLVVDPGHDHTRARTGRDAGSHNILQVYDVSEMTVHACSLDRTW